MSKRKPFPKDSVCKPCWELKYCPYGPLVEYFPDPGSSMTAEDVQKRYEETLSSLAAGKSKTERTFGMMSTHFFTCVRASGNSSTNMSRKTLVAKFSGTPALFFSHKAVRRKRLSDGPKVDTFLAK